MATKNEKHIVVTGTDRQGKRLRQIELPELASQREIADAKAQLIAEFGDETYTFVNTPNYA